MDSRQGYSFKHSSFTFSSLPQCGQQSKCVREEDMLNGCGLVKQYTRLCNDMCSAHPGASTLTTQLSTHSQSSHSLRPPANEKANTRTQTHRCLLLTLHENAHSSTRHFYNMSKTSHSRRKSDSAKANLPFNPLTTSTFYPDCAFRHFVVTTHIIARSPFETLCSETKRLQLRKV